MPKRLFESAKPCQGKIVPSLKISHESRIMTVFHCRTFYIGTAREGEIFSKGALLFYWPGVFHEIFRPFSYVLSQHESFKNTYLVKTLGHEDKNAPQ